MECGQAYEQSDNKPEKSLPDKHLEGVVKKDATTELLVAFQTHADLQTDLPVRHFAVLDVATHFGDLEPI
ncbi:hypothetical protein D3C78_1795460 [compost metagenome]